MARDVTTIQQDIIADLVASAAAVGVTVDPTTWSDYDYRQLLTFVAASAAATTEQLWDASTADNEAEIAAGAPSTAPWLQYQVLNVFQYDATTAQIPELDEITGTFAPFYQIVDPTKRIVTQCAIVPSVLGTFSVKVAKGGTTPVALTTGSTSELSALQSFLNLINIPGIIINASTGNADKIFVGGNVTYSGAYNSVIQANVVSAITNYFLSIPTSGIAGVNSPVGLMRITDLIAAVRNVQGVIDFELINVGARQDGTSFVPGYYNLITGADWLLPIWNSGLSGAGYMVGETTTGYTLNDSLTYIAQ